MTTESTTQTPTTPAAPKAPKSYTVRLTSGASECLITAYKTKNGFTSAATVYSGPAVKGKKRVGQRGATETHPTLEAARAYVEKATTAFVKAGWVRPEKAAGGFARKPDSFSLSNIPKPGRK